MATKQTTSSNPVIDALMQAISPEARSEAESAFWLKHPTTVERIGSRIVLPADPREMPIPQAIEALQRIHDEENQIMSVFEVFEGYPMDAAVAFTKAMKQVYGYATPVPTMSWFGPQPPQLITVKTGPKAEDVTQVVLGEFKVPNIENNISTGVNRGKFYVAGQVRAAEKQVLMELAHVARLYIKEHSIYRGKAMSFKVGQGGELYQNFEPTFIDTDNYKPEELIFRRDVANALEISLFTPIRHTEHCLKHKIPLKMGVLLEGPYGTGKTLTASVCARLCVENKWTFIQLDKVQGLKSALEFANLYSPAVVFAEDIDRITENRDEQANDLLNTIDGVLNKNSQVITVLTTNHVDKINQAMLRPGRLDAIIEVKTPDAEAVDRLIRLYGRGLIAANTDITSVCEKLSNAKMIPAAIREVVERSKKAMIMRGQDTISEIDLETVFTLMQRHLELLNGPKTKEPSKEEALGIAFANLLGVGPGSDSAEINEALINLINSSDKMNAVLSNVSSKVANLGQLAEQANKTNGKTLENLTANLATKAQVDKVLKSLSS